MLENTREILEEVDPLLDSGDMESAGRLLMKVDQISLSALLFHILWERGVAVAEALGVAYLRAAEAGSASKDMIDTMTSTERVVTTR